MQKILCKTTTTCSTPPVNSHAAGLISTQTIAIPSLLSLGFKTFSTSAMPLPPTTTTGSISTNGGVFSGIRQRNRLHRAAVTSLRFSTSCRCSIGSRSRAWVGRSGTWRSWLHSEANGGLSSVNAAGEVVESVEDDSDGEKDKDEKPVRLNRRNRSSSSELTGNPDLLKIPGVGLRNQRKLLDNGIGDVAELKKLYKDKVLTKSYL